MVRQALKTDGNKHAIQAGNKIGDVLAVSITAAGWTAITMSAGTYSKKVYFNTRDAASFLLSAIALGTTYATIAASAPFWLDIAADPGDIIGYAKGTSTTILEVIVLV